MNSKQRRKAVRQSARQCGVLKLYPHQIEVMKMLRESARKMLVMPHLAGRALLLVRDNITGQP